MLTINADASLDELLREGASEAHDSCLSHRVGKKCRVALVRYD